MQDTICEDVIKAVKNYFLSEEGKNQNFVSINKLSDLLSDKYDMDAVMEAIRYMYENDILEAAYNRSFIDHRFPSVKRPRELHTDD